MRKDVHNKVLMVLQDDENARCDDMYLYLQICRKSINPMFISNSFEWVLGHHKELGLPSYESVSRARRKIQETHPELKNHFVAEKRKQKEADYIAYARSDI